MAWSVALNSPANNAVDVDLQPTFTWTKSQSQAGGGAPIFINVYEQPGSPGIPATETVGGVFWTSVPAGTGGNAITNVKDGDGNATTVDVEMRTGWDYGGINSANVTTPSTGPFASDSIAKSFGQDYGGGAFIDLAGLEPNGSYTIYVLAAGAAGSGNIFDIHNEVEAATAGIQNYDAHGVTVPETYQELPNFTTTADGAGDLAIEFNGQFWAMVNAIVIEPASTPDPEPSSVLRVSLSSNLSAPAVEKTLATAETYTLLAGEALAENDGYFWGVSLDGGSTFDTIRSFTTLSNNPLTAPVLTGPADGATEVLRTPTFSWVPTDAATLFDLEVSLNSDFSGTLGVDRWLIENHNTNSYTWVTEFAKEETVYWRVRSTDNIEYNSPWSTSRSFTTRYGVPDAPVLSSPGDGASGVSLSNTFSWTNGGGATEYDIYIDTDSNFSSPAVATALGTTSYTAQVGDMDNSRVYFWKVVARNAYGTAESAVRGFTSAAPNVPNPPGLQSPKNGAVDQYVRPEFDWIASPGATKYNIEIADNPSFTNAITYNDHISTSITINEYLETGTLYYWRVAAGNANGYGSFSSANTFTTQAVQQTNTPVLVSPANNATDQPLQPTFDWDWTAPQAGGGTNYGPLPEASTRNISSIVIDFSSAPSYVNVGLAPLKYNKTGVVTAAIDDSERDAYTSAFQTAQSTFFTDGCGNDIPFSFALAHYIIGYQNKDVHSHPDYSFKYTWAEMAEMAVKGTIPANHGLSDAGDNLALADAYTKWKLSRSQHFPSGLVRGFDQKWYVGTNGADVSAQALANGAYGCDAANYGSQGRTFATGGENLYNSITPETFFAKTYRRFEVQYDDAVNAINAAGATTRPWLNYGFHGGAALSSLINTVASAHGKSGSDKVWFCSQQELIEYMFIREYLRVPHTVNGNQVTITVDQSSVPGDLMFYAATLLVDTDANISNITINGGINTGIKKNSYKITGQDAMINLEWNGNDYTARETMASDKVTIAEGNNTQENREIAQAYVNLVPSGSARTTLDGRMAALGSTTYVASEDPGNIDEAAGVVWDPENLTMKFELRVYPDGGDINSPTVEVTDIVGTAHNLTSNLADRTDYDWSVRAKNEVFESAWANARNFTTVFGPPDAPTLVDPTDGAGGVSTNPLLQWAASGEVDGFVLQLTSNFVGQTPQWTGLVVDENETTLLGNARDYQVTGLSFNTQYAWRIMAKNSYGDSAYAVGTFTTGSVPAPDAPTPLSPANGSADIAVNAALNWNSALRASYYRVRIIDHNTGQTVVETTQLPGTTYSLGSTTGINYDTTYRWQVLAGNDTGESPWSSTWYFTTSSRPLPGQTVLISPSNNASAQEVQPTFTWASDANAEDYTLEVSTDNLDFDANIVYTVDTAGTSHQVSTQLNYLTTYYWRVKARNSSGYGPASTIRTFTVKAIPVPGQPTLLTPAQFSTDLSALPNFTWVDEPLSDSYILQVKKITESWATAKSFTPGAATYTIQQADALDFSEEYQWRVAGVNASGTGTYSTIRNFTVQSIPAPGTPTQQAPSGNGIAVRPSFTWDTVQYADQYELELWEEGKTKATLIPDCNAGCTEYALLYDLKYDTNYYWRMRAGNSTGWSPWGPDQLFRVGTPPVLSAPVHETPVDGSTNMPNQPSVSWAHAESVDEFEVEFATDAGFTNVFESATLNESQRIYQIQTVLSYSTTYYWRVRAAKFYNSGDYRHLSAYSNGWSFTVEDPPVPGTPTISYPTGIDSPRQPLVQWNDTVDTDTWDIDIADDAGFSNIIYTATGLTASQYQIPAKLAYNTTYYIRVRSVNSFGTSVWAEESFTTIELLAPGTPTINTPSNGDVGVSRDVTVSWTLASSSDEYELQISTDNAFTAPVVYDNLGSLDYTFSNLTYLDTYYVRVRGKNEAYQGSWSAVVGFTVEEPPTPGKPNLLAPADNDENVSRSVTFQWSQVVNTDTFLVEIATDGSMSNIVYTRNVGSDVQQLALGEDLDYLGSYFWRVTASNAWRATQSDVSAFVVEDAAEPTIPVLGSPTPDQNDVSTTPTFQWSNTFNTENYHLQVSQDITFANQSLLVIDEALLTQSEFTVSEALVYLTKYYWRVKATNAYKESAWTTAQPFITTDGPTPTQVIQTYPEDGQVNVPKNTSLVWRPSSKATYYDLEISPNVDFIGARQVQLNSGTQYDVSEIVVNNDKYFWRVRGVNVADQTYVGDWSTIRSFRIESEQAEQDPSGARPASSIQFDLVGCNSFIFEHHYRLTVYPITQKALTITFPDGNVLRYAEKAETFPELNSGTGLLGELSQRILGDLDELGYNTGAPTNIIMMDSDTIKNDVALFPDMFTDANGFPAAYNYSSLPDGVYQIDFTYQVAAVVSESEAAAEVKSVDGKSTQFTFRKEVMNTCLSDACINSKIEKMYEIRCKDPMRCNEREAIRSLIMDATLLKEGAAIDFSEGRFANANDKLTALKHLCSTGELIYKKGC